jgi:hypothetical protein
MESLFDYKQVLGQLAEKGRALFGTRFKLCKADLPILIPITAWMLRDEPIATHYGLDLQKGLFLQGPMGFDKTCIMELMSYIRVPNGHTYQSHSCVKLSITFAKEGPVALDRLSTGGVCFEDLGKEMLWGQHYRNKCIVMQQMIHLRYNTFLKNGVITHFTSDLSSGELEESYGMESRGKLKGMVNRVK